ncbi:hypothetical protein IGI04_014870, partial [Brassica rapa subsp. trilocularis]
FWLESLLKRNPGGVVEETLMAEEKPNLRTIRIHIKILFIFLSLFFFPQKMFGLLKKSKPQQDIYFPFKTVLEKEQMIFGNKKQFASNGFDFVQKQRKQRKRQNMFDDDEKWVKNGDRPFSKAKRSNRDVFDQNELQTYVSLEKMLHKAIHAIRQLKKKGNINTSPAPKQQSNFYSLSNSDLKTNVLSSDKSKAVKPTSKAHSTRCFKCHMIGHYANKCQEQRPLVTLENENVETEPEKEDPLPIFDDFTYEPMEGILKPTKKNHLPFKKRTKLKEGNDLSRFVDQSIGANHHGDQDVLNKLTEVRSSDRTDQIDRAVPHASRLELWLEPRPEDQTDQTTSRLLRPTRHSKTHSRARISLGREETEDGHAFLSGGPSRQSCKRPYLYPVHPSGSDEPEHYLKGHLLVSQFIFVCCLVVSQRTTFFLGWLANALDSFLGVPEVSFAFSDHIQHPAKVILSDLERIR